ncbi:thiopurine S-methyltransferase [Rheinheimera nanhaiensis]|uniref:Thiopurine S-methyltransferase n=1 Tax=Rheinheimera nanhaiensis E407-8 TaxID=562729 RepID=I1DX22_9GAMM|nr:thiopurine S-methyltransferase [Rheinheimera nanhaiensis]GAB58600.1 thiopurine S-methyltransferase [Rheinheimera nanhaiensis E407-8]
MDTDFWLARWQNNELGFQLDQVHPLLQQCLEQVLDQHKRVLVPLCGKSLDMCYLATFLPVSGVELSQIACDDFFSAYQQPYQLLCAPSFRCYMSERITLWQGDFFALSPVELEGASLVYDRAALIALPEQMRQQYAAKLRQLLPAGSTMLLISLEYPQHEKQGPPFSVTAAEIGQLFPGSDIELLAELEQTGKGFARRRFVTSYLIERAYRIRLP